MTDQPTENVDPLTTGETTYGEDVKGASTHDSPAPAVDAESDEQLETPAEESTEAPSEPTAAPEAEPETPAESAEPTADVPAEAPAPEEQA